MWQLWTSDILISKTAKIGQLKIDGNILTINNETNTIIAFVEEYFLYTSEKRADTTFK